MTNRLLIKVLKIILIFFLVFVALVLFVIFLKFSEIEKRLSSNNINYNRLLSPDYDLDIASSSNSHSKNNDNNLITGDANEYFLGADKAKITIVEFADFACPHCKQSFSKIREISIEHNQDIKYIFRDLPIVKAYSIDLALAARCAGEQGLFWPMHDRLFINQGVKTYSDISSIAQKSGVNMEKFKTCYDTKKYLKQIKKDYNDAKILKIDKIGTPIWFINGKQIAGSIPDNIFDKIINGILKN